MLSMADHMAMNSSLVVEGSSWLATVPGLRSCPCLMIQQPQSALAAGTISAVAPFVHVDVVDLEASTFFMSGDSGTVALAKAAGLFRVAAGADIALQLCLPSRRLSKPPLQVPAMYALNGRHACIQRVIWLSVYVSSFKFDCM